MSSLSPSQWVPRPIQPSMWHERSQHGEGMPCQMINQPFLGKNKLEEEHMRGEGETINPLGITRSSWSQTNNTMASAWPQPNLTQVQSEKHFCSLSSRSASEAPKCLALPQINT